MRTCYTLHVRSATGITEGPQPADSRGEGERPALDGVTGRGFSESRKPSAISAIRHTKEQEGTSSSRGLCPSQVPTWSGAPDHSTQTQPCCRKSGAILTGQGERAAETGGRDTQGEHKTSSHGAVKVPKRLWYPLVSLRCLAFNSAGQCPEYTKLHVELINFLSRI